jgi:hypothetical protein
MASNPTYFEIVDFMFESKSLEQIISFRPSEATQRRVEELIAKEQAGTIVEQEHVELEDYMQFDHIMTLDDRGQISPLFDPRRQHWNDYFRLSRAGIQPLTAVAEATVRLLRVNDTLRVQKGLLLQQAGIHPRGQQV